MSVTSVHVMPDGREWIVEEDGKTVSKHYSQDEAEKYGRKTAERENAELLVHDSEGRVERKDSFQASDSNRDDSGRKRDDSRSTKDDEPRVIKR